MAENDLRNTFIDLTPHRFKLYPGNHFHFPRKWFLCLFCYKQPSKLVLHRIPFLSQLLYSASSPARLWNERLSADVRQASQHYTGKENTNSLSHAHHVSPPDLFLHIKGRAADLPWTKEESTLSSENHHHRIMGRKDTHLKSMDNCTNRFSQSSIQKVGVSLFFKYQRRGTGYGESSWTSFMCVATGSGNPRSLGIGVSGFDNKGRKCLREGTA